MLITAVGIAVAKVPLSPFSGIAQEGIHGAFLFRHPGRGEEGVPGAVCAARGQKSVKFDESNFTVFWRAQYARTEAGQV
jgi:hypothetical protein